MMKRRGRCEEEETEKEKEGGGGAEQSRARRHSPDNSPPGSLPWRDVRHNAHQACRYPSRTLLSHILPVRYRECKCSSEERKRSGWERTEQNRTKRDIIE